MDLRMNIEDIKEQFYICVKEFDKKIYDTDYKIDLDKTNATVIIFENQIKIRNDSIKFMLIRTKYTYATNEDRSNDILKIIEEKDEITRIKLFSCLLGSYMYTTKILESIKNKDKTNKSYEENAKVPLTEIDKKILKSTLEQQLSTVPNCTCGEKHLYRPYAAT